MNQDPSFPRLEVPFQGDLQSCQPEAAASTSRLVLPARSVWVAPALKLLGICCVLTCVAWLGQRSRDETTYGPRLANEALPRPAGEPAPAQQQAPPAPPPPTAPPAPCVPTLELAGASAASSALLPDGRLVLNEASAAELDRLPGIGTKRADDIVALRSKLGRFKRLTDLLRVRGIGPRSLESLKPHLVLDRPPAPAPAPSGDGAAPRVIPVESVRTGN